MANEVTAVTRHPSVYFADSPDDRRVGPGLGRESNAPAALLKIYFAEIEPRDKVAPLFVPEFNLRAVPCRAVP
ncbi:hypothetical protein ACPCIR_10060 [Mycobacterium sp. NPDC051198]